MKAALNDSTYSLTEVGPPVPYSSSRPTVGLLNANPFAEGIANLGAQMIAKALLDADFNVEFGFADTCTAHRPFIGNMTSPSACGLFAVSIPFEDTYHHVPRLLRACGVEPLAENREEMDPIVVAGGMALINPMPLAPFFDVMVLGEGREIIVRIAEIVDRGRKARLRKREILREIAELPHLFVRSLYRIEYDDQGYVTLLEPADGAAPTIVAARPLEMTEHPIHSIWTSPRACYKYDDYFSVMVAMGCHLNCPFCVVGQVQGRQDGRALNIDLDQIVDLSEARRGAYGSNLVKLFFASSFSRQTAIDPLSLMNLLSVMVGRGFQCRVGSLNVKQADGELLELVKAAGQTRVTFAPETSEDLRGSIGKTYSKDAKLLDIASLAADHDLGLDVYTMLGLPEERPRHVRDLANLIDGCRARLGSHSTLEVSINPCFAKAQTPYERYASVRPEVVRHRFDYIRSLLRTEEGIEWVSVIDDAMCYYQPILALGGEELAPVLLDLSRTFHPSEDDWRLAVWTHVGDDRRYFSDRAEDRVLPWEHIVFNDHRRLQVRFESHRERALQA